MIRNKFRHLAAFGAAALLSAGIGVAQSTTDGAIAGTVFDATNAAIPNATVIIHSDGTGAETTLTTGSSGEYRAPQLSPGTYTVTVKAPNFAPLKTSNVVVQVNEVTALEPHLTAGSATSETVEVTAEIPVLRFDSPEFGGHLDNREIENIPINNRRWSSLALTTPGVTNDTSGFGLLSFRAIPSVLNNVQIDGVDDNQAFFSEERGRTRAGYSTSQVAVREFQVNTGVYSAELGRAVGGVVNSVTKQGSNQVHGEVYFYHRGDEFSSKNPKVTLPNPNGPPTPFRPKDKRNQYGFGVGGPLIKDKLFGFYAFDAFRRNFPGVSVSGAPALFTAANLCTNALLTATGATSAQCTTAYNDLAGALGIVPRFGNQLINTPKITWQINQKHSLDAYYHRLRWDSPGGVQTQAALAYSRDAFGTDFVKLDYGVAKLNSLITDHLTNELRFQYARELNNEGQQTLTPYTAAHLVSGNNVTYAQITSSLGGFNLGSPYYSYRYAYPDERKWEIGDTAAYIWGKHTIRFGVDFDHNYDLQNTLGGSGAPPEGTFAFANPTLFLAEILRPSGACNGNLASGTPSLASSSTGGGFSCYSSFNQSLGPSTFDLATLDSAYFVQDDWKVRPNLTLNLGARYDYQNFPAPYAKLITAAQTNSRPSDKNNIAARVGFSYDPYGLGKTVIRGGFGMYYGRVPNSTILSAYVNTGSQNAQAGYTVFNGQLILNGGTAPLRFPNVLAVAPPVTASAPSIAYLDPHLQNPYTEQFDLQVQQDLGFRNVLSLSYIGALGRELPNYINVNLNPANFYTLTYTLAPNSAGQCYAAACGTRFTQRVYSSKYTNGTPNTLNTSYNAITDLTGNANSNYNAFTVDITNRQWKFITFDANYTWAHALDYNVASVTNFGTNNYIDPFANPRSNYGNSSLNIRHRAVGWAILNIPGLKGNEPWTYLTNGWSIKPLVQIQSGLPYSYGISTGSPASQSSGCQATPNGPQPQCLAPYSSGIAGTGVSSYIPFFGRNTLTQPRNIVVDARVQKDFRLPHEGTSLQLLAELFNVANHQNITSVNSGAFTLSGTTLTSVNPTSLFGQATSSGVNGNNAYQVRQLQLGARVIF